MKTMGFNKIAHKERMGRKVYWKNDYAWVAKYFSSNWWNPFDWYLVKIDKEN